MRAGFLLAGGASRRFGADKALHEVEGVPMALRVARAMQAAGLSVTLVAPDDHLASLGLPILLEPSAGERHPLRGVVAALERCEADGVELAVLSPCDLPWARAEVYAALMAGEGARVAEAEARRQPLLAQLPAAWLPRARALLAEGAPARALVREATPVPLPALWLRNVNRPSDLGDPP